MEDAIHDADRIRYHSGMLDNLLLAKTADGVDIRGYFAWSKFKYMQIVVLNNELESPGLLDNFEWSVIL